MVEKLREKDPKLPRNQNRTGVTGNYRYKETANPQNGAHDR